MRPERHTDGPDVRREGRARRWPKSPKAACADECGRLEQLPNIGPALAADLRLIGIEDPRELAGRDALALYRALGEKRGRRQDPCVLDTFMAATDFMRGAPAAPWWHYTARRKRLCASLPDPAAPPVVTSGGPGADAVSETR